MSEESGVLPRDSGSRSEAEIGRFPLVTGLDGVLTRFESRDLAELDRTISLAVTPLVARGAFIFVGRIGGRRGGFPFISLGKWLPLTPFLFKSLSVGQTLGLEGGFFTGFCPPFTIPLLPFDTLTLPLVVVPLLV